MRRGPRADYLCVELLFWRCKQLDAGTSHGTSFPSARDALIEPGQCDEAHWPYVTTFDPSAPYDPPTAVAGAAKAHATMTRISTDPASVSAVLATGHPVVAGLQLWDGFYDCDSATIAAPAGNIDATALHAVCFTGLDEDNDTIMIRNSWGRRWGRDGYAWLRLTALPRVLLEAWVVDDDLDPD